MTATVTVEGDAENQTIITEQTPLLGDHQADVSNQESDQNAKDVPEKKPPSWYIWRIFWAIVAALILALFIKGWIDAGGDVDVSDNSIFSSVMFAPEALANLSLVV